MNSGEVFRSSTTAFIHWSYTAVPHVGLHVFDVEAEDIYAQEDYYARELAKQRLLNER